LRASIEEANALDGRQWVYLPQGDYVLELDEIEVTDRVTVIGFSSNSSVVDGNSKRAFRIKSLRSDFKSISIVNSTSLGGGGALIVTRSAELNLLDTVLRNNSTSGGGGGAIFNEGTVSIRRSRLYDNNAGFPVNPRSQSLCGGGLTSYGGAIVNNASGSVRIYQSSFVGNRAIRGGALSNSGFASISNSTFSGNLATSRTKPMCLAIQRLKTLKKYELEVVCITGELPP